MAIHGVVYDLTEFGHPGGPGPIMACAGKDCSETYPHEDYYLNDLTAIGKLNWLCYDINIILFKLNNFYYKKYYLINKYSMILYIIFNILLNYTLLWMLGILNNTLLFNR